MLVFRQHRILIQSRFVNSLVKATPVRNNSKNNEKPPRYQSSRDGKTRTNNLGNRKLKTLNLKGWYFNSGHF